MSLARIIKIAKRFNVWSLLFLGILAGLVGCEGCQSGANFSELELDPKQVIDYGRQVTEGRIPPETVVYGQLMVGDSSGPSRVTLEGEQKELATAIGKLRALPGTSGNFLAFVDDLDNKIKQISPQITSAQQSAKSAKDLAGVLEPEIKSGGKLETLWKTGDTEAPAAAKNSFNTVKKDVTDSFGRLYKASLALAQSLIQKEANTQVAKIKAALNSLQKNADDKRIFSDVPKLDAANAARVDASTKLENVSNYVSLFTTKNKVGAGFVSSVTALETAINQLNTDYVTQTEPAAKAEATSLYDEATLAVQALVKLGSDYTGGSGIEQLKTPKGDQVLDALLATAFTSSVGALGDLRVENPTDTNNLMSMLASGSVVGMPSNTLSQYMVYSLASGVVSNIQERFGLSVSNVRGLDPALLIQAKAAYGMDDAQFNEYVKSRAERLRKESSEAGRNEVYVLLADALQAAGVDIPAMVDAFASGGGKVLAVASDLSGIRQKGPIFFPKNLTIAEAIATASAALENDPGISPNTAARIANNIGRMTVAVGTPLKLDAVGALAKDAALRVKGQATPSNNAIELAVKGALTTQNLPTIAVDNSGVLTADLSTLQANVDKDPQYYAKIGVGREDAGLRIAEMQEMRKTQDENKLLRKEMSQSKDQTTAKTRVSLLGKAYQSDLEDVRARIDLNGHIIKYKDAIRDAETNAIGMLDSMGEMLGNSLCFFKSKDMEAPKNPADYDNAWFNFTGNPLNAPARQEYLPDAVKNPMALFKITRKKVIPDLTKIGPLGLAGRAAISLNCFLNAPNRGADIAGRPYDARRKLASAVSGIKSLVGTTADEAKDIASRMLSADSRVLIKGVQNLRDKTKPPADATSWKFNISPYEPLSGAGMAFKVFEDLYGFADVSADAGRANIDSRMLLPQKPAYRTNNLPLYFFAVRVKDMADAAIASDPIFAAGNDTFDNKAATLGNDKWTISKIYGSFIPTTGIQANVGTSPLLPAADPSWLPSNKKNFERLNSRLWAWFGSSVGGKITDASIPHTAQLYAPISGEDWFDDDHVFIDIVYKKTNELKVNAIRHIIAEQALAVLKEYMAMLELLYGLLPEDYNAFLKQVPATTLSTGFKDLEGLVTGRSRINNIAAGDKAGVLAWRAAFLPPSVEGLLVGKANEIRGAAPIAPEDAKLAPIWGALTAAVKNISASVRIIDTLSNLL